MEFHVGKFISILLALVAASLLILLLLYAIWVRIKQSTYTEKRFNFVALWACTSLVVTAVTLTANSSLLNYLLENIGMKSIDLQTSDKILIWLGISTYLYFISRWARHWNGLISLHGAGKKGQFTPTYLVVDGLKETARILLRQPAIGHHLETKEREPAPLPPPITSLPTHEQVRELAIAKWAEFIIPEDAWISEASCWQGTDTALNRTVLLVTDIDAGCIKPDRLRRQAQFNKKTPRIIIVLEDIHGATLLEEQLSDLAADITVHTFEEFVISALPVRRYAREIAREYAERNIANSLLSLSQTYVPTRVHRLLPQSGRLVREKSAIPFDQYVDDWLAETSGRHLALLGDYGQGKSSEALALTNRLLEDNQIFQTRSYRLPLLIRLTGLSPKNATPEELLGAWGARYGMNGRALLALHRAGRTLMILDAFDEMSGVADRADRIDHFGSMWRLACPHAKILFTGRPNFFLDDLEIQTALGIAEGVTSGPYCSAVRVATFCKDQMRGALRWLPQHKIDAFMAATERSEQLTELASRPSLLFQIAQLWDTNRIGLDAKHLNSASVIRSFITYSLERQVDKQRTDVSTIGDKYFIPLRRAELDYFTSASAVDALTSGRSNTLTDQTLRQTITILLDRFPQGAMQRMPSETGALTLTLAERLRDKHDPVEACVQAVRTHGVIEHDPSKIGQYRFSHKSFAEVLAAEVLTKGVRDHESTPFWRFAIPVRRELVLQDVVFRFSAEFAAGVNAEGLPDGPTVFSYFYPRSMQSAAKVWYMASVAVGLAAPMISRTFRGAEIALSGIEKIIGAALRLAREPARRDQSIENIEVASVETARNEFRRRFDMITMIGVITLALATMLSALATYARIRVGEPFSRDESVVLLNLGAIFGMCLVFALRFFSSRATLFSDFFLFAYLLERLGKTKTGEVGGAPEAFLSTSRFIDELVRAKLSSGRTLGGGVMDTRPRG